MPAEQQHSLYAELWVSFTALIRSYVAANDLAKPASDHARVDEGNGTLIARNARKSLELEFDATAGVGEWMIYRQGPGLKKMLDQGGFSIDEESRILMNGSAEKLELEVAAEKFASKVFDEE